jgi:23S rRNA (uracil1939-C5)-methyltransferase
MLCKHFGICGGCTVQDKPYSQQSKEKEAFVLDLFKPFITDNTAIYPIKSCQTPWRYRNKMEFSFGELRDGSKNIGLYKKRGIVVDLQECLIVPTWFEEVLEKTRQWWQKHPRLRSYYPPRNRGSLRTLTLRDPSMIILTVSGEEEFALNEEEINSFKDFMPDDCSVILRKQILKKNVPTEFVEEVLKGHAFLEKKLTVENKTLHFSISPSAFFQPNSEQAQILYQQALNLADIQKEDTVFDLYSGTGTLGMFASFFAKKVHSIELSKDSVLSANKNANDNQITNIEIHEGDVGKLLKSITDEADLIMVDPPRAGLDDLAIQNILDKKPKKILYISCNPQTQATNLIHFQDAGYQLTALQTVDQFPHTSHIENIAVLS